MKAALRMRPAVHGTEELENPGFTSVPITQVHRALPKVAANVPTLSYYRFDERTKRVVAIVTAVAGYHASSSYLVAWDACSECTRHIRRCVCRSGASAPRWLQREAVKPKPKRHRMKDVKPKVVRPTFGVVDNWERFGSFLDGIQAVAESKTEEVVAQTLKKLKKRKPMK